jgi:hypothetical protein
MYPDYIVKFLENPDKYGNEAVIYKHKDGRYYNATYWMNYIDGSLSSSDGSPHREWQIDISKQDIRFNNIIGEEAYDNQDCFFFEDEEFMYEFICELF